MGIYNCAGTLAEAIDSILAQTYTNWELILCDDGSSDDTYAIAQDYQNRFPDKIILLKNEKNMGLNYTLNHCLEHATGEFIARMDGDDLCDSSRFEKEVQVLEQNEDLAVVSTGFTFFDEINTWGSNLPKEYPDSIDFLRGTPFCHAPSMIRRAVLEEVGRYTDDIKYIRVEDYDLWVKVYAAGYIGKNIQEKLYHIRDDRNAAQRRKFKYRINEARIICKATKLLKLPIYGYIYALVPIIKGLLPLQLYRKFHRKRLSK